MTWWTGKGGGGASIPPSGSGLLSWPGKGGGDTEAVAELRAIC